MGEHNKIFIALVFTCVPLGCTTPWQEAKEIRCVDKDGMTFFYTGSYEEENWYGYFVQLDDFTRVFYPKDQCVKIAA